MTWQRAAAPVGTLHAGRRPRPGRARGPARLPRHPHPARAGARERLPLRPVQLDQRAVPPARATAVVGSIMKNPALARTYALIGREGRRRALRRRDRTRCRRHRAQPAARARRDARPAARRDDAGRPVALPRPARRRPPTSATAATTSTRWRPSSSGGTTVGESLNILSNFNLGAESPVQVLHHYLEATRLAYADRNRYIGDPPLRPGAATRSCSRRRSGASAPA